MNVGLLLITHGSVGKALLQSAKNILGVCPMSVNNLPVPQNCRPDQLLEQARLTTRQLDSGDGVLILTDMYGATPSNIACRLHEFGKIRVVSGLNLPMLIRILNYPHLSLDELAHKAVTGGRDGVLTLEETGHA